MWQGMYIRSCIHPFVAVHPSREHVSILLVGFWGPLFILLSVSGGDWWLILLMQVGLYVFLGDDVLFCWGLIVIVNALVVSLVVLFTLSWVLARSSLKFVLERDNMCHTIAIKWITAQIYCTRHVCRKLYVYHSAGSPLSLRLEKGARTGLTRESVCTSLVEHYHDV